MTYTNFITRWIKEHTGKKLNPDMVWGAQCVDVPKQLTIDICNISKDNQIRQWNTVTGGAEGMWNKTHPNLLKFYDKMPASKRPFKPGDIVIWDKNKLKHGQYGHTAICIKDYGNSLKVLEQTGGNFVAKEVSRVHTYKPTNAWYKYIVGALTPKQSLLDKFDGEPKPAKPTPPDKPVITRIKLVNVKPKNPTTHIWNIDFPKGKWAEAKTVDTLKGFEPIICDRKATNSSGGRYWIEEGRPDHHGINIVDVAETDELTTRDSVIVMSPRVIPQQPIPKGVLTTASSDPKPTKQDKPNQSAVDPLFDMIVKLINKIFRRS